MTMIEKLLPAAALLVLSTMVQPATAQTAPRSTATSTSDTVLVAPPTGERAADRASIEAALGAVQPGGTVQFAPGTYLVGEFIRVSVPRVTLQGHAEGTTLRGCEPERFDLPDGFGMEEVGVVAMGCTGLYLIADRQTVRGLTFEHAWQALWIGCCLYPAEEGEAVEPSHVGGHLIEGNTFRASVNGFRVIGDSPEPVVIRDNDFVNVWHAGAVNGRTAHILGNRISVPDAAQVPPNGFPGLALVITPYDTRLERAFTCAGNVIAGNRVEGHPEGIAILAIRAGASCRENVIRDNTIRVERVRFTGTPWGVTGIGDPADSTLAGVPIALSDLSAQMSEIFGVPAESGDEVLIRDNLIEGNRIVGAEGLGIEILGASDNRIVGNTITRVAARDPFPGNTMYVPPPWGEANGSGIWISPASDGNEIVGNMFEDVEAAAVFLEGDDNRVELGSAADVVRDLGTGNQISVAAAGPGHGPSMGQAVLGDSVLADTLLSLTDDLAASWTRLEPDDYLDRFSDDLVFYFEGSRVSRSEFAAVVRGTMEALTESTFEVSDPDVEILGPDAAVVSFGLREVMVDRIGAVTDLRGALTLVWERREGEWRVVRAHESLPPADGEGR